MGEGQYNNRGTKVYVGGLTEEVRKEDLEVEFQRYGKLNSVWVALNPPGFAFVEFAEWEDARAACEGLNNMELMGIKLRVEMSRGGRGSGRGGGPRGGGRGAGFQRGRGGGPTRGSRGRYDSRPGGVGGGFGRREYNNDSGAPRYRTKSPM
ncbi:hypothetical protein AAG570_006479 [Ranatra chinensis]|uniref:RRM domain-containing protein n=1 Tax=Ranatra chinensis TaxID=642074 RepID=A0ABD0YUF9_9HEMI